MLLEPQVPFPVSSDHRVRPDLVKLDEPIFLVDREFPKYFAQKLEAFAHQTASAALAPGHDPKAVAEALRWLWNRIPKEHLREPLEYTPENTYGVARFEIDPAPLQVPPENPLEFGKIAALCVQEDLVLMHGTTLEAAWVCFPSNWNPAEKVGRSFAEIHIPVPHSEKLLSAQENVAKAMSQKGPYVRHVWGLGFDPRLSYHPECKLLQDGQTIYFRCERQVTVPLPELNRSWFLIRVYMTPIEQVADTPERKQALLEAVRTMPEAHRAYKGGTLRAFAALELRGFFD
ncbi:MAG: DUF3445 domain-containing protein [Meiothermus sp.]|nr:DUF3445 domain-containing protein [Meiothermus sp.]